MMLFSQYLRIERDAGGSSCSDRAFIRAALDRLTLQACGREYRTTRQAWLRSGLSKLQRTRAIAARVRA